MAEYIAHIGETTEINFDSDLAVVTFKDADLINIATVVIERELINQKYYYSIDSSDLECAGLFYFGRLSEGEASTLLQDLTTPPKSLYIVDSTEIAFVSTSGRDIKLWNLTLNLGDVPEPDFSVTFDVAASWDYENNGIDVSWSYDYDSNTVNLMPWSYVVCVYERKIDNDTNTGTLVETIDIPYGTDEHYDQHIVYTNGKSGCEYLFRVNATFNILSGEGGNYYIDTLSEYTEWLVSALKLATKTSSGWIKGKPFVKDSNGWKEVQKIFAKTSDGWKELIN